MRLSIPPKGNPNIPGTSINLDWFRRDEKLILSAVLASGLDLRKVAVKYSVYPPEHSIADIIDIVFRKNHDLVTTIKHIYYNQE
jgi:hypothetical protein